VVRDSSTNLAPSAIAVLLSLIAFFWLSNCWFVIPNASNNFSCPVRLSSSFPVAVWNASVSAATAFLPIIPFSSRAPTIIAASSMLSPISFKVGAVFPTKPKNSLTERVVFSIMYPSAPDESDTLSAEIPTAFNEAAAAASSGALSPVAADTLLQ